ncbi:hypothetical protein LRS64_09630 (plasmid) [Ligilactobacillus salivarius]|uniref:hypothetical protein n=1 Tax=Ligilactobacillus salivarius TaxID=1624 RepID=UPI003C2D1966
MFLLKLHDLIKHNYENGLYFKDYSYKAKDYSYKSDDFNSLSDFDKGKFQAQTDYQSGKAFKHYPKLLFEFLNFVFLRKMQEIVNFINGYNYEMRKLQKMDKN